MAANAPIVATTASVPALAPSPTIPWICSGSRMPGTAPQMLKIARFATDIDSISLRSLPRTLTFWGAWADSAEVGAAENAESAVVRVEPRATLSGAPERFGGRVGCTGRGCSGKSSDGVVTGRCPFRAGDVAC